MMLSFSFNACIQKAASPIGKFENYIVKNGVQKGDEIVLDCPDIAGQIVEYDFIITAMENIKDSNETQFELIKGINGVRMKLLDSSITNNGSKMERVVLI
ncbi:MAG: hypothetical protein E7399_04165 [Ruminococcaceae bacterium]|nr:hypothetical protein [Oscillospiraceae bacterium]